MKKIKKILIVEDEASLRRALVDKLKKEKFEVIEAKNGEEAREKIFKSSPDLVVLDLMLPGIPGEQILKEMNEFGFTERVNMFRSRCPEEFYLEDVDPDALDNQIDRPENADRVQEMRMELLEWMKKYNDTDLLPEFQVVAEQEGFNEDIPRGEGYSHIKPVTE